MSKNTLRYSFVAICLGTVGTALFLSRDAMKLVPEIKEECAQSAATPLSPDRLSSQSSAVAPKRDRIPLPMLVPATTVDTEGEALEQSLKASKAVSLATGLSPQQTADFEKLVREIHSRHQSLRLQIQAGLIVDKDQERMVEEARALATAQLKSLLGQEKATIVDRMGSPDFPSGG